MNTSEKIKDKIQQSYNQFLVEAEKECVDLSQLKSIKEITNLEPLNILTPINKK